MKKSDRDLLRTLAEIEGYSVIGEADDFLHVKNRATRWFRYNPLAYEDQALALLRQLLQDECGITLRYDASTHEYEIRTAIPGNAWHTVSDHSLKRAICLAVQAANEGPANAPLRSVE